MPLEYLEKLNLKKKQSRPDATESSEAARRKRQIMLAVRWAKNNPEKRYLIQKRWNEKNKVRCFDVQRRKLDRKMFGGNRQKALERDNFTCRRCGITNEMHKLQFMTYILVHHKNGDGKDHRLSNLITCCKSCHVAYHKDLGTYGT